MDAAASMIEKAIIANPTYAEAYNNLGYCFLSPFRCLSLIEVTYSLFAFVLCKHCLRCLLLCYYSLALKSPKLLKFDYLLSLG